MSSRLRGNHGFRCGSPPTAWATLDSRRRGQRRGGRPTAPEQAVLPVRPGSTPVRATASGGTRMASIRTARVLAAGVGRDNSGNSSAARQQAVGSGASNQSNTAQVNGSAPAALNQGNSNVLVDFAGF
ncbi:hypothetical protein AB0M19_00530 [Streptomyces sp. NPDC051920]|uniref:hypothetical protein n=1 Tax=Streptomyces sp. NPDC051920 TaxID=3155523 RepID=UPI0034496BF1